MLVAMPLAAAAQRPPAGMTQGKIIDYPACTHTSFAIDGGEPPAGLVGSTPDELLHQGLPAKATRRLRGLLLIQVQIDSSGSACCPRIQNFTAADNEDIRALALDQLISHAAWQFKQTGPRTGRVAASSITLKVRFDARDGYTAEYYRHNFAPDSFKGGSR
ncbi:MAG: hypothetical protein EOO57_14260 [Hymenobacter sp.]|nr:MAG: hypothetical protein EOO57_14260 [Hymenobacter sp.]